MKHQPHPSQREQSKVLDHSNRPIQHIVSNRKARHDYFVTDTIEAGIVLQGTEVKSLRAGKCNLQDSFAMFEHKKGVAPELFAYGIHISPYEQGSVNNHMPTRPRKLLLKRSQLQKLYSRVQEKGATLVPLSLYFSGQYAKVELGIAKGKAKYDKRESIKRRDAERALRRNADE
ncbi:MAG: SsrA-binding protein SmpB [Bacteroidota bacterium]|nr:SsrA-binding protein SmpB [Candidatus Kapabacteria bacterium]MDW8220210.1 SsrA-binding protein SmpB [Bacteroidota bacterium]